VNDAADLERNSTCKHKPSASEGTRSTRRARSLLGKDHCGFGVSRHPAPEEGGNGILLSKLSQPKRLPRSASRASYAQARLVKVWIIGTCHPLRAQVTPLLCSKADTAAAFLRHEKAQVPCHAEQAARFATSEIAHPILRRRFVANVSKLYCLAREDEPQIIDIFHAYRPGAR